MKQRKKGETPRVVKSFRLSPEAVEALEEVAATRGETASAVVEALILAAVET